MVVAVVDGVVVLAVGARGCVCVVVLVVVVVQVVFLI